MIEDRTIALAGMIQACRQVQKLARSGEADEEIIRSCLQSVLVLDAVNTASVYGGISGVSSGLKQLAESVLNSTEVADIEVLRYVVSLVQLQTRLYKDKQQFSLFGQSIERLSSETEEALITTCSDIYQKFVSTMQPQIIVQGEQGYLQQAEIPPKIRALLLAGFRSAVLWQQKGGGRFNLIWQRTKYQQLARLLLSV